MRMKLGTTVFYLSPAAEEAIEATREALQEVRPSKKIQEAILRELAWRYAEGAANLPR